MSTPVNKYDMLRATIEISLAHGLNYNSFPYNSFPYDEEEIVIPPLQQDNVVYDSPPQNQIMAGDPRDPPSNARPPMREHLANGGYVRQRLVFQPSAVEKSPVAALSERTKTHRPLAGSVALVLN